MKTKQIAILGSTGSIGTQTLDVCRRYPEQFHPYALSAYENVELLIDQAREFQPEVVCIANETHYGRLSEALSDMPVKVYAGSKALCDIVTPDDVDVVVAAMVGYSGLEPTIAAINAGKTIALANKETLVVAGELICRLINENHVALLPVDSEHSAIFQCLQGERVSQVDRLLLTASGGPFRMLTAEQMRSVTAADALKHPNWTMGAKITIDSATMMNKGFEIIEAQWLFGIPHDRIDVLVHPQSIVHSAVSFVDGSVKAQLAMPDMQLPIQYALTYPDRMVSSSQSPDLFAIANLTFEKPDMERFPCLKLAKQAIDRGGSAPCVLNAAHEVANKAFRDGRITFPQIADTIISTLDAVPQSTPMQLQDYVQVHHTATDIAMKYVERL